MDAMFKEAIGIGLAASLLSVVSVSTVQADEWNKKTILTFSQPVEIPGQVLPAGTYVFKLADSMTDRHIVQVFNADESQIIATVMTIPDYRLIATDQTVIKFGEVPRGSPEAIRAWFYPGNKLGQEFVYPKRRAAELAMASKAVVPAVAVDVANPDDLKTVPLIAITPERKETALTAAIQTSPVAISESSASGVKETGLQARRHARQLPHTASVLPLIVLLGFASIAAALGLMVFGRRGYASVR